MTTTHNTTASTRSIASTRSRWAAIGAAVAVSIGAVGFGGLNSASAEQSTGDRPVFVSINPCRLIDTRSGPENVGPRSTPMGDDETATFQAHGANGECTGASEIPSDALALSMNVTALKATGPTFLTFWGDGPNPGTANLNPTSGQPPIPNAVTTPLSATGSFNIYNEKNNVDVVIDLNGYYVHHSHDEYVEKQHSLIVGHTAFQDLAIDVAHIALRVAGSGFVGSAPAQCMIAELPVSNGMTIDQVAVRGYSGVGGSTVNLMLTRLRHAPGSGLSITDLGEEIGTANFTTTGAGTIDEGIIAPAAPIVVDKNVDTYYLTTCSSDGYAIVGAEIDVSYS